jgi:hypothetical protein
VEAYKFSFRDAASSSGRQETARFIFSGNATNKISLYREEESANETGQTLRRTLHTHSAVQNTTSDDKNTLLKMRSIIMNDHANNPFNNGSSGVTRSAGLCDIALN